MDATKLSAFFQSVKVWPDGDGGAVFIAEKIARLLGASWVAFRTSGNDAVPAVSGWYGPTDLRDGCFTRLKSFETHAGPADRVPAFSVSLQPGHLAIARLVGARRGLTADGHGDSVNYGGVLAGFSSDPGERETVYLLAAAQKLVSLAECAALEADIQLRNQFLSIASHELKTPLTSIYGVLQLQQRMLSVKKDEPPEQTRDRQESYLKMTIRQTQRLNELIDGLLDVSRIQNGRFMAEPSDTDVAVLLKETVAGRLAVIAQEAGVRFNTETPDHLRAWVDPVRMEEVVTNLVMNAIRFSPEGGVVWIRLREDGEILRLSVRDQGPAVPEGDQERIFRPFERAQRTARFGGLGLGLFISRQIAQLHGGNVRLAESVPGKGNVFEASFPKLARQAAAS